MSDTAELHHQPWYEVDADRVSFEIEQFEKAGLSVAHRIGMKDGRYADRFVIESAVHFEDKDVPIEVVYPFDYPDQAPTVFGPPGLLGRHQVRTSGNFCLLDDADADWWPGWPAAHLVAKTLRSLLSDTEKGPDAVAAGEADLPEPASAHIRYGPGVVLVPDPFWSFELGAVHGDATLVQGSHEDQLVLTEGVGIGSIDPRSRDMILGPRAKRHRGVWIALAENPYPAATGDDLLVLAEKTEPDFLHRLKRLLRTKKGRKTVDTWIGVSFHEEGPQRGQTRRAWVFLRVTLGPGDERVVQRLIRVQALSATERSRRLPELAGIGEARVAVIGAGSLGSPIAVELAKAGVGWVTVADHDIFDVNNAVRHAVGIQWAGVPKAQAVALEAGARNPFSEVVPLLLDVGGGQADSDIFDSLLQGVDVVVDTTGAQSVARIADRRCREAGKRLVIAGLSAGSYGGEVIALRPNGPCFFCFVLAQRDGIVPTPNQGPRNNVTPVGCTHPAFSGAGFDASELAAIAVRTVVQATYATSYPVLESDWVVVNFRGSPRWQAGLLERHPDCPHCQG